MKSEENKKTKNKTKKIIIMIILLIIATLVMIVIGFALGNIILRINREKSEPQNGEVNTLYTGEETNRRERR